MVDLPVVVVAVVPWDDVVVVGVSWRNVRIGLTGGDKAAGIAGDEDDVNDAGLRL